MAKPKPLTLSLYYYYYGMTLSFILFLSKAKSSDLRPHALPAFNLSLIQQYGSCPYTVVITTSCSSTRYTRDQISLSFGDAYGNQIYAPRLDDPSTGRFERCSSDTFTVDGPCAYQICYVYLYRSGPDGWNPESVKIYPHDSYYTSPVTFDYGAFIPGDIWYGFNFCSDASSVGRKSNRGLFIYVAYGLLLNAVMYFCM